MKSRLIATIFAGLAFAGSAHAERVILNQSKLAVSSPFWPYLPHFWEFDPTENPPVNGISKYACGHAALKVAAQYVSGKSITIPELHTYFSANYQTYALDQRCGQNDWHKGYFCANLYDMEAAAKRQLNLPNSKLHLESPRYINGLPNYAAFLQKVKDGVRNNFPVITSSGWQGNMSWGHMFVIVGFNTDNTSRPEDAWLFIRDVKDQTATSKEMDDWVTVKEFVDAMKGTQLGRTYDWQPENGFQFLFVKP